jgi:hypothetical protein
MTTSVDLTPPAALEPSTMKRRRRVPVWAWVAVGGAVSIGMVFLLAPLIGIAALTVLITGIVALARKTPTWLRFRSRRSVITWTAISAVVFLLAGLMTSVVYPAAAEAGRDAAAAIPAEAMTAAPTSTKAPHAEVTGKPVDARTKAATSESDTPTLPDAGATAGPSALAVLATLEVKGRAAKTGYDRHQFGQRWLDTDRNGCDTRNDVLARDLTGETLAGPCKVLTGVLADPYTATTINFVRGQDTSADVQIDHVVALANAWQTGAQKLTAEQRATLANDPLNLLAVDGSANAQKRDGDAATWLPSNKAYRCAYVARQVSVKATYSLWVTQPEHDAIARVLNTCPGEPAITSTHAAQPVAAEPTPAKPAAARPAPAKPAPAKPAPAPAQPAPAPAPVQPAPAPAPVEVYYKNCDAVRAAGAAPIYANQPGYAPRLDRDKDGIGCDT